MQPLGEISDQVSDSQASQILRDALGEESLGDIRNPDSSFLEDVDVSSILGEQSLDARSYPTETDELNYHLHGLAPTQTQNEDPYDLSNSQKENTPTTSTHKGFNEPLFAPQKSKSSRLYTDASSRPPSRNAVPDTENINEIQRISYLSGPEKSIASKNKATETPQRPSTKPNSKRFSRQSQDSAEATSQDSFVGPVPPEDKERRFLSSTKQFDIPLSEIGRPTSTSGYPPGKSVNASVFHNRMPSEKNTHAGHSGKILVEDSDGRQTQSSNAQSQQSHNSNALHLGQSQIEMTHKQPEEATFELPAGLSQSSREDSQPGSSYARILEGDYTQEPTQAMEPTQPSGEQEDTSMSAPMADTTDASDFLSPPNHDSRFLAPSAPSLPPHDHTASTTTSEAGPGPRSLLRMINPVKQWKMNMLMAQVPPADNHPTGPVSDETQVVEPEEDSFSIPGLASHPEERYAIAQKAPEPNHVSNAQPAKSDGVADQPASVPPPPPPPPPPVPTAFGLMSPNRSSAVVPDSEPTQQLSSGKSSGRQTITSHQSSPSQPLIEVVKKVPPKTPPPAELSDDDEDDIPLAAQAQPSMSRKIKEKAATVSRVVQTRSPASGKRRIKPSVTRPPVHDEVPSSAPEQDQTNTAETRARASPEPVRAPTKRSKTNSTPKAARSGPVRSSNNARKLTPVTPIDDDEDDEDDEDEGDNDEMNLLAYKDERELTATESIEDNDTELDSLPAPTSTPATTTTVTTTTTMSTVASESAIATGTGTVLTRKRKRTESSAAVAAPRPKAPRKGSSSASVRARANTATTAGRRKNATVKTENTPQAHLGKTARALTGGKLLSEEPTRVFALWKRDGFYYPGVIYSHIAASRYRVNFDDGTNDEVDIKKMRRHELHNGDELSATEATTNMVVSDATQMELTGQVTVEIDDGETLERLEVEVENVRIAARAISKAWNNRMIAPASVVPLIQPKSSKVSPSQSGTSLVSENSKRDVRTKPLLRTGFVMTWSNNDWDEKEKTKVVSTIKNLGGTVFDDWFSIYPMNGKSSNANTRWMVGKEEVRWNLQDKGLTHLFLISDDASRKPKFLIALALGVPCVSFEWIDAIVTQGKGVDWRSYLLPAGFCEAMNMRVSQLVDWDWGNSFEHIRDIMNNPAPAKPFKDLTILCLDGDFVPTAKAKRMNSDETFNSSHRLVPKIILSMGASRVEAAAGIGYASDPNLVSYDYIVVREEEHVLHDVPEGVQCVHFGWVKDCLIAGRVLPIT